jgi:hypothetical protein
MPLVPLVVLTAMLEPTEQPTLEMVVSEEVLERLHLVLATAAPASSS